MARVLYFDPNCYIDAHIIDMERLTPLGTPMARGELISNFPKNLEVVVDKKPQHLFNSGGWFFVSPKFANVIKEHCNAEHYQLFQASVRKKSGQDYGLFYILHVRKIIDCFDRDLSEYKEVQGIAYSVKKFHIIEDMIEEDATLFKLKGVSVARILVSDFAYSLFSKAGLEGLKFYGLQEWSDKMVSG